MAPNGRIGVLSGLPDSKEWLQWFTEFPRFRSTGMVAEKWKKWGSIGIYNHMVPFSYLSLPYSLFQRSLFWTCHRGRRIVSAHCESVSWCGDRQVFPLLSHWPLWEGGSGTESAKWVSSDSSSNALGFEGLSNSKQKITSLSINHAVAKGRFSKVAVPRKWLSCLFFDKVTKFGKRG